MCEVGEGRAGEEGWGLGGGQHHSSHGCLSLSLSLSLSYCDQMLCVCNNDGGDGGGGDGGGGDGGVDSSSCNSCCGGE